MDKEQLKNPPGKYRPIPFWSWNDKLEEGELRRQVRLMGDAGMGGFFMHARGGLSTEYMSEEWFHCVDAVSYTHLDVYKRQAYICRYFGRNRGF